MDKQRYINAPTAALANPPGTQGSTEGSHDVQDHEFPCRHPRVIRSPGIINLPWTLNEAHCPPCKNVNVPKIILSRLHQAVEHVTTGSHQLHQS